ncbi:S8 family serine peptidase [Variovorax saccharolyticus]|uniref:S8 family serine peptidase n=1 Tax=Variovorax saccharolyticus TaxID=3053516 RepID=UPI0025758E06|nr:S8 family serine peptidase [Variovorax sp. J31P216]MDM0030491.1 S8 family serine peptidase [Variovorax sp. J31P216]
MLKITTTAALFLAIGTPHCGAQTTYAWMHPDVSMAWGKGYKGQGVNIVVSDALDRANNVTGYLGYRSAFQYTTENWLRKTFGQMETKPHGEWVAEIARKVAPSASVQVYGWDRTPSLVPGMLNIVNLSYTSGQFNHFSVQMAAANAAVIIKAAGNNNQAMGTQSADVMGQQLKGMRSVIFVGALSSHGTPVENHSFFGVRWTTGGAVKATYSNTPGNDPGFRNQFLVVGVPESATLNGTSFAAPQVSAYAAILGSKFPNATPDKIAGQLLNTARTDTIRNYDPNVYGRGEASLSRALAPSAIR